MEYDGNNDGKDNRDGDFGKMDKFGNYGWEWVV